MPWGPPGLNTGPYLFPSNIFLFLDINPFDAATPEDYGLDSTRSWFTMCLPVDWQLHELHLRGFDALFRRLSCHQAFLEHIVPGSYAEPRRLNLQLLKLVAALQELVLQIDVLVQGLVHGCHCPELRQEPSIVCRLSGVQKSGKNVWKTENIKQGAREGSDEKKSNSKSDYGLL